MKKAMIVLGIIWYYKSVIVVPIQILVTQLHLFCIIRV